MLPHLERKLFHQPLDQRRSIAIQEERDREPALLRVPEREDQRLRAGELSAEGFVAFLRGLDHLSAQALEVVLHAAERRLGGPCERGIDFGHHRDDPLHGPPHRIFGVGQRQVDALRQVLLEELVERRLVLRLKILEGNLRLQRKRAVAESMSVALARGYISGIGTAKCS